MKPTEDLVREHNAIIVMLSIMDKIASIIRDNKDVEFEDIEKITDFLITFADKCHHGKEERVLFPELVRVGVANENGPVGVMLYEHEMGRRFISEIVTGVEKFKEGYFGSLLLISQGFSNYTFLLRNHINKENNILFPMADRVLDMQKQSDIEERFRIIEKEFVGEEVHEKYLNLLAELRDKYLIFQMESA